MERALVEMLPFGIASRARLTAKAYSRRIPLFSAAWRHFLIIFPAAGAAQLAAPAWLPALRSSRAAFARQLSEFPDRPRRFRAQANFQGVLYSVVRVLDKCGCLSQARTDQVLSVLQFFSPAEPPEFSEKFAAFATYLYSRFSEESVVNYDQSPMHTLLDVGYIAHDLYSCLSVISKIWGIFYDLGEIDPVLRSQLREDVPPHCYQMLFDLGDVDVESYALWTLLFSGGLDLEIYHQIGMEILALEKVAPDEKLPFLNYACIHRQVRRERCIGATFETLAVAIEQEDSLAMRRVVAFQSQQFLQCRIGNADPEEVIDLDVLLAAARALS
jgi:hypothetical protein